MPSPPTADVNPPRDYCRQPERLRFFHHIAERRLVMPPATGHQVPVGVQTNKMPGKQATGLCRRLWLCWQETQIPLSGADLDEGSRVFGHGKPVRQRDMDVIPLR